MKDIVLSSTRICLLGAKYLTPRYYEGAWTSATEIADHYKINVRTLNVALSRLVKCGILRSKTGGENPGFIFTVDPKKVSVVEIIVAIQGAVKMNCGSFQMDCSTKVAEECDGCILRDKINYLIDTLYDELAQMSIYDIWSSSQKSSQGKALARKQSVTTELITQSLNDEESAIA